MKSIYQFIVSPVNNKRYNNTKKVGDVDLVISTSENYTTSNRQAIVIETPLNYEVRLKKETHC